MEASAPAAGALASALFDESRMTMCGSTEGCCIWWAGMAFDEQRLPKVIAAYDLSSWLGCSSNSSSGWTQPLSTMAAACCGAAESCESAERAWSCERMSCEASCSANITMPPDSKSCSDARTSPGQRSATSDAATCAMRGCSCDISWIRCGTAPALRTAVCACGKPTAASACVHSSTAAVTSVSAACECARRLASGAATPASSMAEHARLEAESCCATASAVRCSAVRDEPSATARAGMQPASAICSRHSLCDASIASSVSAASCSDGDDEPSSAASEKTTPFCSSLRQSSVLSSQRLASTLHVASTRVFEPPASITSMSGSRPPDERSCARPPSELVRSTSALTALVLPSDDDEPSALSRGSSSSPCCSASAWEG
mmetsp:Transcript_4250/g.11281  ORF Transcript_4250/g.11281 Transcript_4250/m.11281 type:complete len:376 (-) Transcript_4250:81-1208(-)